MDARDETEVAATPTRQARPRRLRVLVVDDDAMILLAIGEMLAPQMDVVRAHGGTRALEILAGDGDFDAVICDVGMPEVDGRGVLDFVRRAKPELVRRFLFFTAGVYDPTVALSVRETGRPLVPKSSLSQLAKTLEQILGAAPPPGQLNR